MSRRQPISSPCPELSPPVPTADARGAGRLWRQDRPEDRPVLSRENRLRRRTEFSDVVRRGRRASRPLLTVHVLPGEQEPARAGLVVSKAVGGSVVRSRVSRRLRHQLRELVPALPAGTRLVVRAAPAAATADSTALGADLRRALERLGLPG